MTRLLLISALLISNHVQAQSQTELAAQHLSQAIAFKTISYSRPADEDQAAFLGFRNWLDTTYPRVKATMTREVIPGGAVLYRWAGSDKTLLPIMFMAHYDVVPVEPGTESLWTQSAFAGTIAAGYVWGRGALDNKGMVVTLMETAEALIGSGFVPKRTIYFAFGSDEEVGGIKGSRNIADLLAQRAVRLEWVLDEGSSIVNELSDPSNTRLVAKIGLGQKGYATILLTATGQGGSSSTPPAKMAVEMLSRALMALAERPFPATDPTQRTTLVPTLLQAGIKDNVLPTIATATLNARIAPGDTVEKLVTYVRSVVADCDIKVSLSVGVNPPPLSSTSTTGYLALQSTINKLAPSMPVTTGLVNSTTDARHMVQLTDAIYYFMPWILHEDDLARIHGVNERLSLTQLGYGIRFFTELISKQ